MCARQLIFALHSTYLQSVKPSIAMWPYSPIPSNEDVFIEKLFYLYSPAHATPANHTHEIYLLCVVVTFEAKCGKRIITYLTLFNDSSGICCCWNNVVICCSETIFGINIIHQHIVCSRFAAQSISISKEDCILIF